MIIIVIVALIFGGIIGLTYNEFPGVTMAALGALITYLVFLERKDK
jgi:uncharacterized protein YqgC (DUF456 family)